ncbi:50S ribosomal protein L21 [Patescibacteria group bacterium]|nr:50S ribosomal protein L21 [Patescibacteria group bacterium]MBU0964235.1 50S ribosomal protein L21 [Patescibacteria group bacterium]
MKFAIIATGGKQYKVTEGKAYTFEKLDKKVGAAVTFDEVLLYSDGKTTEVGTPTIKKVKVSGKVISQEKAKKVTVIKYKHKVRYRRKKGHRQQVTKVNIEKIGLVK